eukprot:58867-Amphidinium_carterae.1
MGLGGLDHDPSTWVLVLNLNSTKKRKILKLKELLFKGITWFLAIAAATRRATKCDRHEIHKKAIVGSL